MGFQLLSGSFDSDSQSLLSVLWALWYVASLTAIARRFSRWPEERCQTLNYEVQIWKIVVLFLIPLGDSMESVYYGIY